MKQEDELHVFESTGRRFKANGDIIGIDDEGGIYQGYDSDINIQNEFGRYSYEDNFEEELTHPEKQELALFMIKRWAEYAHIPLNLHLDLKNEGVLTVKIIIQI